jgi:hypothetical protein
MHYVVHNVMMMGIMNILCKYCVNIYIVLNIFEKCIM